MFLNLPSIPDMIRQHHESQRKPNPGFQEPALPADPAMFWEELDEHGWGAEHDVTAISEEGYTFLSFVLFYCPERMGEAVALVQQHPEAVAIVNRADPHGHHEGWTPLHWAVRLFQGQAWVPTLLALGADVSLTCSNDEDAAPEDAPQALGLLMLSFNPRMQQFYQPDLAASEVAARALLQAGADLEHSTDEQSRPIHGAAQFASHLLPLVLEHPVGRTTVNAIDVFAQTPLTRALIFQPQAVQQLLDAGADPSLELPRKDGVFKNAPDVARKLLSGTFETPHTYREESRAIWENFLVSFAGSTEGERAEAKEHIEDDDE